MAAGDAIHEWKFYYLPLTYLHRQAQFHPMFPTLSSLSPSAQVNVADAPFKEKPALQVKVATVPIANGPV